MKIRPACEEVLEALRRGPATATQVIQYLFNKGIYDAKLVRDCIRELMLAGLVEREPDPSVRGFVFKICGSRQPLLACR